MAVLFPPTRVRGAAEGRGDPRAKWRLRGATRGIWRLVLASVGTPGGKRTAARSNKRPSGHSQSLVLGRDRRLRMLARGRCEVQTAIRKIKRAGRCFKHNPGLRLLQDVADSSPSGRPCVLCCSPHVGPGKGIWGALAACSSSIQGSTSRGGPPSPGALCPGRQPGWALITQHHAPGALGCSMAPVLQLQAVLALGKMPPPSQNKAQQQKEGHRLLQVTLPSHHWPGDVAYPLACSS